MSGKYIRTADALRRISRRTVATVNEQAAGSAVAVDDEVCQNYKHRTFYNIEYNNPNSDPSTIYLYIGDTTDRDRTLVDKKTLAAYGTMALNIDIFTAMVKIEPNANDPSTPLSNRLYALVADSTKPIEVAVNYYDED